MSGLLFSSRVLHVLSDAAVCRAFLWCAKNCARVEYGDIHPFLTILRHAGFGVILAVTEIAKAPLASSALSSAALKLS